MRVRLGAGLSRLSKAPALTLVLEQHPGVDPAGVTWLALGSTGRREPVFSSAGS